MRRARETRQVNVAPCPDMAGLWTALRQPKLQAAKGVVPWVAVPPVVAPWAAVRWAPVPAKAVLQQAARRCGKAAVHPGRAVARPGSLARWDKVAAPRGSRVPWVRVRGARWDKGPAHRVNQEALRGNPAAHPAGNPEDRVEDIKQLGNKFHAEAAVGLAGQDVLEAMTGGPVVPGGACKADRA
jgi:hypothetical protein